MFRHIQFLALPIYRCALFLCWLSVVTMLLGQPVFGAKFAISNLVQLLLVLSLLICVRPPKYFFIGISAYLASVFISLFSSIISYDFFGKPAVIAFQIISLINVMLSVELLSKRCSEQMFDNGIRSAITCSFFLAPLLGANDILGDRGMVQFGMDDKSHAAIILCFLSFACLSLKKPRLLMSLGFFVMSAMTLSRLPVIFAVTFLPTLIVKMLSNHSLPKAFIVGIFTIGALFYAGEYAYENSNALLVIDRISSLDAIQESDSTNSHNILLREAFDLKMDNVENFLFGVSPGAFGDVLIRSDINYSDIASFDPTFVEFARKGKAPAHSTHLALFVEYPIFFFAAYVCFLIWIGIELMRLQLWTEFAFFMAYNGALLFYSAHNKAYYFVILVWLLMKIRYKKQKNKLLELEHKQSVSFPEPAILNLSF